MMIDVEVVEKRSSNYLPLLFLLLGGFFFTLKNILYNIGLVKMKSLSFKEKKILSDEDYNQLFNLGYLEQNLDINVYKSRGGRPSAHFNNNNKYLNMKKGDLIESPAVNENLVSDLGNNNSSGRPLNNNKGILNNIVLDDTSSNKKHELGINNNNSLYQEYYDDLLNNNYLIVVPDWNSAANRVTQISAIGDVLYTVYHSYIYILSVLLLLGMVGAIILTADSHQEVRVISIENKKNKGSQPNLQIAGPWSLVLLSESFINYVIKYYLPLIVLILSVIF
jgi:hypothetical protein